VELPGPGRHRRTLAARGLRRCLEDAPTPFADEPTFREFVRTVVLRHHLARLPYDALRARYLDAVVARVAPSFELDYVRLNLSATRA